MGRKAKENIYYFNEIEKIKLYNDLVEFFGPAHQSLVCIEEMSELTKELIKFERGESNYEQIAEEIADVQIMLEQIIRIYGVNEEVKVYTNQKLKRTQDHLSLMQGVVKKQTANKN